LALALRHSTRRREVAVRLARDRSTELAQSTTMIQRITKAMDECFYTYTLDPDGRAATRFATPGWGRGLGLPDDSRDAAAAWQRAVHPDDAAAHATARERVQAGESTDLEFRVVAADGSVHWLWAREHPIGAEGKEVLVDGVVSDISTRKSTEGRLAISLQRVEHANQELEQAHAEAERLSRVDAVTGIFNRRHFGEVLAEELARPERQAPAVLLLDLDHFKRVNDEHGHLTGDGVLRAAAGRIASILRSSDCLARWGGEEFAILAPATERAGAARLAERARRALAETPVHVDGVTIALSTSVGVAVAENVGQTPDALVKAADQALYEAKRAGRNCVRLFDPQAPASPEPAAASG
jgi:diguanylate cyclase (GGDEF)-like protein/PAS domain S-box-containing protein